MKKPIKIEGYKVGDLDCRKVRLDDLKETLKALKEDLIRWNCINPDEIDTFDKSLKEHLGSLADDTHIYRGGRPNGKDKSKVSPTSTSAIEGNNKNGGQGTPSGHIPIEKIEEIIDEKKPLVNMACVNLRGQSQLDFLLNLLDDLKQKLRQEVKK